MIVKADFNNLFLFGSLARVCFFVYGLWQDANFAFKYTDIDYYVYTDAAKHVSNGESPFDRATYRYTPMLAYSLLPSVSFFPFGKLLFIFADLGIGYLIYHILRLRGFAPGACLKYTACWIFHPVAITISTRGNADPLVGGLCLLAVYFIMKRRVVASALCYGLAVHFKIYPIIYLPAFLTLMDRAHFRGERGTSSLLAALVNRDRVVFSLVSGGLFIALGALFYGLYGYEFLYETYLYHLIRRDNRHNFSVYFYDIYLSYTTGSAINNGALAFFPQFGLIVLTGLKYGRDLPFAMFLCTYIFVVFNKVCTAQYFLWYVCLLPLVLPGTSIQFKWTGCKMLVAWVSTEVFWLLSAKGVELDGVNVFLQLWGASMLFFFVNAVLVSKFITSYRPTPLFSHGVLEPVGQAAKRR
jgi:GPI mannosyltransferase 1 subunit M|eukprot:g7506.t1